LIGDDDYLYLYVFVGIIWLIIISLGGIGNVDLYYNLLLWVMLLDYMLSLMNLGNSELIVVNNLLLGYVYIMLYVMLLFSGVSV